MPFPGGYFGVEWGGEEQIEAFLWEGRRGWEEGRCRWAAQRSVPFIVPKNLQVKKKKKAATEGEAGSGLDSAMLLG